MRCITAQIERNLPPALFLLHLLLSSEMANEFVTAETRLAHPDY